MNLFRKIALAAALAGCSPSPLFACAACYGKSSDPLAYGMNWGIFTLLGIVTLMLASIATFFVFLIRREAAAQENKLPDETLSGAKI
jgi:heme/copper-type cytochrome/quinol oxidase subunit 2